jgi:hypothetical protein
VLGLFATNTTEQLAMPDTDFAQSFAYFVSRAAAEEALGEMIDAAKAGGTVKIPSNPINEVVITKIRMMRPTSAEVSVCLANNYIAMGAGRDKIPNTADDVIESDVTDVYDSRSSWKFVNGLWRMRAESVTATRKGAISCGER